MKADEQVIKEILQQLESAWNRYDSATFAAGFAEDANFIHIFGGQLNGRAAIEAAHRNIFETIYRGAKPVSCCRASACCAPTSWWYSHERA